MKIQEIEGDRHKVWEQIYTESEKIRTTQVLSILLDVTSDPFTAQPVNFEISDLLKIIQQLSLNNPNDTKIKVVKEACQRLILNPEERCTLLIIETTENQHFNIHVNQTLELFIMACDRALADNS